MPLNQAFSKVLLTTSGRGQDAPGGFLFNSWNGHLTAPRGVQEVETSENARRNVQPSIGSGSSPPLCTRCKITQKIHTTFINSLRYEKHGNMS